VRIITAGLALLLASLSAYAQQSTGNGTDATQVQQEKDFAALCIANPNPPKECPPKPSTLTSVHTQPLSDTQKALLNGTAAPPQPIDPSKILKDAAAATNKKQPQPTPSPSFQPAVPPPSVTTDSEEQQQLRRQEAQDAEQTAKQRQAYENGQRIGSAGGSLMVALIVRHRINSFCKKNPSGSWTFANGNRIYCSGWNASHK
jgi:hypothetical protein